jgi:hypothetical protein
MSKLPWEKLVELHEPEPEPEAETTLSVRELSREFFDLFNACTHAMEHVRIRVSHAGAFRMAAMRADDPANPCGEIKLNDGSTIRVETFGAPGPTEPVHTGQEIMQMIVKYIRATGLTIPV